MRGDRRGECVVTSVVPRKNFRVLLYPGMVGGRTEVSGTGARRVMLMESVDWTEVEVEVEVVECG